MSHCFAVDCKSPISRLIKPKMQTRLSKKNNYDDAILNAENCIFDIHKVDVAQTSQVLREILELWKPCKNWEMILGENVARPDQVDQVTEFFEKMNLETVNSLFINDAYDGIVKIISSCVNLEIIYILGEKWTFDLAYRTFRAVNGLKTLRHINIRIGLSKQLIQSDAFDFQCEHLELNLENADFFGLVFRRLKDNKLVKSITVGGDGNAVNFNGLEEYFAENNSLQSFTIASLSRENCDKLFRMLIPNKALKTVTLDNFSHKRYKLPTSSSFFFDGKDTFKRNID
jgi:hypothetical protein